MSRSVTISDEAYRKLYDKRKLVAAETGHDDPSISDIILYLLHHIEK